MAPSFQLGVGASGYSSSFRGPEQALDVDPAGHYFRETHLEKGASSALEGLFLPDLRSSMTIFAISTACFDLWIHRSSISRRE